MNKYILTAAVIASAIFGTQAQDRVKGSRNVINVSESLSSFTHIKVTDGLAVHLIKSGSEGYDLEMDDNLVELIDMEVRDSLLVVSLNKRVRSSKKMDITIRFNELRGIAVDAKAKVLSQSPIEAAVFKGSIYGNASLQAEVKAQEASFVINENSKLDVDYQGDALIINASDNAFIKADVNTINLDLIANGRTDIDFTGNTIEATITLDESAEFKAKTFDADIVNMILRGSAKATLRTEKEVQIDMNDKSVLTIYGEPAITVERFSGTATLQKREEN